jgi:ABC-type oligopeptide transport system ATPase subunit
MTKPLYLKHYGYLLKYEDIFEVFFPGLAKSTKESRHNDVIVITGKKGSGKRSIAKIICHIYHRESPEKRVIIFSGIPGLYKDLTWAINVDLKELKEEENEKYKRDFSGIPNPSEFRKSLVVFDDCEKYPHPKVEQMLWQLMNVLVQNERNFNTCVVIILHQLNKGVSSSTMLRVMDSLVIFPHGYDQNTFNTLVNPLGLSKEMARKLYTLDERFILIHISVPSYVFLGSSMEVIPLK